MFEVCYNVTIERKIYLKCVYRKRCIMKNESNLEPDYKEMYFKMVRASEAAIRALADAQRNCEEIYIEEE